MKRWQDFLDSLSTKGGNVFVLFFSLGMLFTFMIHVAHDQSDSALIPVAHDMVVGFGGALLSVLSGGSSRQQMTDRVETAMLVPPKTPSNAPQPTPAASPAPGNGG